MNPSAATTSTTARPLRADAARNRQALVDAAFAAFRRHGVHASLDDIAKAAGVGSGTLYRHFASRDALVLAVIEDRLASLADLGGELAAVDPPIEAVERWLLAYIDQAGTFQGLAATLLAPQPEPEAPLCHAVRAVGAALVDRAVAAGELRADARADDLLDLAAAIAWVGEHSPPDPQRPSRLLHLCLAGARP
jgi:AcrR family transcriptional regulator